MTTITIDRAVVEQALEALQHLAGMNCDHSRGICVCEYRDAANNLRAALAQAEPVEEPVAWADKISFENAMKNGKGHDVWPKAGDYETRTGRALIGIYTTPPTRRSEPEPEPVACSNTFGCRCPKHFAAQQAEPVQGPFALPCPTPKACREHCCHGACLPAPQQAEPVQHSADDGEWMTLDQAFKKEES